MLWMLAFVACENPAPAPGSDVDGGLQDAGQHRVDSGSDSAPPHAGQQDAGQQMDAGLDASAPLDAGDTPDAATDSGTDASDPSDDDAGDGEGSERRRMFYAPGAISQQGYPLEATAHLLAFDPAQPTQPSFVHEGAVNVDANHFGPTSDCVSP